ncbi:MAG TPA: CopD family protein, partial [Candidatus Binatia bacterium]|nr:CopD family protein [Candidatus Binatia bacterium]
GGLAYQAHVLAPAARRGDAAGFAAAAARARPVAWSALIAVVLTGLYNVSQLGPAQRVIESGAATLLAGKFLLVMIVLPLAAHRDFRQVVALRRRLESGDDPGPVLARIAWLDRAILALAAVTLYLGVAVARG